MKDGRGPGAVTGDHLDFQPPQSGSASGGDVSLGGARTWRGRLHAVWSALVGGIGLVVGLVPHVLHHVGLLAGTALVAGSGGTALFGGLGLLASVPFLVRLRRRFGSWRAPAIGLLIFAAMFSLSTFVIGPAISGAGDARPTTIPAQVPAPAVDHSGHH